MARPTTHPPDAILDAARNLVLERGPRAAGMAAIAATSGAPIGSIYHRFGSRDGLHAALWLRTIDRFQQSWLAPTAEDDDPVETGAAMAAAAVAFARSDPADTRLLLAVRPRDLVDSHTDQLAAGVAERNTAVAAAVRELAHRVAGRSDAPTVEQVMLAVVDLPHGALRRHAGRPPPGLEAHVRRAARALLGALGAQAR